MYLLHFTMISNIHIFCFRLVSAELSRREENKLFCLYCLFAWGMLLIIVIAGIILDFSRALEMGYGK